MKVLKSRLDGKKVRKFWWLVWLCLPVFPLLISVYSFVERRSELLTAEVAVEIFLGFVIYLLAAQVPFLIASFVFIILYGRYERVIFLPLDKEAQIAFEDLIVINEPEYCRGSLYVPAGITKKYTAESYSLRSFVCGYKLSLIIDDRIWKLQIQVVMVWAGTPHQAFEFWQKNGTLESGKLKEALSLELDRLDAEKIGRIKDLHPSRLCGFQTSEIRAYQLPKLEEIIREHLAAFMTEHAVRINKVSFRETTE